MPSTEYIIYIVFPDQYRLAIHANPNLPQTILKAEEYQKECNSKEHHFEVWSNEEIKYSTKE